MPVKQLYRACYAVTRTEYYLMEATTPEAAQAAAFTEGKQDEAMGETTNVVECGVELVLAEKVDA